MFCLLDETISRLEDRGVAVGFVISREVRMLIDRDKRCTEAYTAQHRDTCSGTKRCEQTVDLRGFGRASAVAIFGDSEAQPKHCRYL